MTIDAPLLDVRNLTKVYGSGGIFSFAGGHPTRAVDNVSFAISHREILGLVGESGSGKSTTGRLVLRLEEPTAGEVRFDGSPITGLSSSAMKPFRRDMQVVFQDPYAALNPRMTAGDFVAEPFIVHGIENSRAQRAEKVAGLFKQVGLDPRFMSRYPHEFSGGQRQRINIARAIALRPRLIVADEPITALDVSIQAQIVNLFQDLQRELGVAYLFIAHDLSMVRYLCHRVAVMLRGRIVEIGPTEAIFENPQHAYTRSLLSSIPIPNPRIERARRPIAFDYEREKPVPGAELREVGPGHAVLV
ncbi:ABC transporter ATP-binding protein [Terrarubrum flagellatum]|uniref:ABC transporter ATP-binding protein n=1 Tax=Terrirubrum flagellatum TaxID=2895980 RepID=UPI0031452C47